MKDWLLNRLDHIWMWIRGINGSTLWRAKCARCGFTGQVHYTGFYPCIRFKPESDAPP